MFESLSRLALLTWVIKIVSEPFSSVIYLQSLRTQQRSKISKLQNITKTAKLSPEKSAGQES